MKRAMALSRATPYPPPSVRDSGRGGARRAARAASEARSDVQINAMRLRGPLAWPVQPLIPPPAPSGLESIAPVPHLGRREGCWVRGWAWPPEARDAIAGRGHSALCAPQAAAPYARPRHTAAERTSDDASRPCSSPCGRCQRVSARPVTPPGCGACLERERASQRPHFFLDPLSAPSRPFRSTCRPRGGRPGWLVHLPVGRKGRGGGVVGVGARRAQAREEAIRAPRLARSPSLSPILSILFSSALFQVLVAQKVATGVYKGVTTTELDELAAETAAAMTATHPDYAVVSKREEMDGERACGLRLERERRAVSSAPAPDRGSHTHTRRLSGLASPAHTAGRD